MEILDCQEYRNQENLGFGIGQTCDGEVKSRNSGNIRDLVFSIQGEMKCNGKHQRERENLEGTWDPSSKHWVAE